MSHSLENASVSEVLAYVEQTYGARAAISSSFSVEDVILIHEAAQHARSVPVFTLDTGRLPPETYELMNVLSNRYGVKFETFAPERVAVERLVNEKGHFSFRQSLEDRHFCCEIRKLEPLGRALKGRAAWVTGLRREQSPTRAQVNVLETDAAHGGIAKVNPLAAWTEAEVWAYVREHQLPYNALYDRGYRSIGCAPCTRAIRPYEDVRDGRWWWERAGDKECGLHVRR